MSAFNEMINKDLSLMRVINQFCSSEYNPRIHTFMSNIVSKHPWRDIGMILWAFFAIGVFEIGASHFWVVMMNITVAAVLARLLEAKRPVEFDIKLQPLSDISAESYGFPSRESYISIVIMGHILIHLKSILFSPIAIIVIFITGFSRIFAKSRFPHQIVGSWVLGVVGLGVGMHCCDKMEFHKMTDFDHNKCIGFVIICLLCYFALSIENNDSRLLNIPKSEFIKVVSDIISGGENAKYNNNDENGLDYDDYNNSYNNNNNNNNNNNGEDDFELNNDLFQESMANGMNNLTESPRFLATMRSQLSNNTSRIRSTNNNSNINGNGSLLRRKGKVKSDSLYYLQLNLEERDRIAKTAREIDLSVAESKYSMSRSGSLLGT
eukprot:gene9209-12419_t